MRRISLRSLLELPLVCSRQIHLGDVNDAHFDLAEQRLVKLSIEWVSDDRQVFGPDLDLPYGQIAVFEPHQIVVAFEVGETAGLDFDPMEVEGLVSGKTDLLDHDLVTAGGDRLGRLADVYVAEEDGAVLGYEVEMVAGPNRIFAPSTDMEFRDGAIVVPTRIKAITLAGPDAQAVEEAQEEEDYVFETEEVGARIQEPDLAEEPGDSGEFPAGHRAADPGWPHENVRLG